VDPIDPPEIPATVAVQIFNSKSRSGRETLSFVDVCYLLLKTFSILEMKGTVGFLYMINLVDTLDLWDFSELSGGGSESTRE
jgi:hypothetical protein